MANSAAPIALFMNGTDEDNLTQIIDSQADNPGTHYFIQPHSADRIVLLAESAPTPKSPIPLYLSITKPLGYVSYSAKIVGWADKRKLTPDDLKPLNLHIKNFQPAEEIYLQNKGKLCVNLISVVDVKEIQNPFPVSRLIKTSNNEPLKTRKRAGGWSTVFRPPEWLGTVPEVLREVVDAELQAGIANSLNYSASARELRLAIASKLPQIIQVVSQAFRRNPDVVVSVLKRANGVCEECHKPAPFNRASDGEPFLEVHHRIMLSNGGEDTVANALAVCPNCHRKLHFG